MQVYNEQVGQQFNERRHLNTLVPTCLNSFHVLIWKKDILSDFKTSMVVGTRLVDLSISKVDYAQSLVIADNGKKKRK